VLKSSCALEWREQESVYYEEDSDAQRYLLVYTKTIQVTHNSSINEIVVDASQTYK